MHSNKDGSIVYYIYPEQQPKNIYTSNMFCAVTSHQPVRMFLDRYTLIIFSNSSLGQDLLYKKYITRRKHRGRYLYNNLMGCNHIKRIECW